jgi:glucose/arabinose dehydrogenase
VFSPRTRARRALTGGATPALLALAAACADAPTRPAAEGDAGPALTPSQRPAAQVAPGASVQVKVDVPASMRGAPFDVDRYLRVPPNFTVRVHARVPSPRFLAVAPNGDLLVSRSSAGVVMRVRPNANGDATVTTWLSGLRRPHDVVFHTIGGVTYAYVAESHQINRYVYNAADGSAGARQVIISGLPDNSSGELQGQYGHQLKNIALDGNRLYLSIASPSNADPADLDRDPKGGAVYLYDAAGGGRRLYAQGLRNAEGLAIAPGTNTLWVVVNNRDNIAYPFQNDWNGDGTNDYGRVMQSYVDDHPPEEFTAVRDGGHYGWPFCNPNPDTPAGLDNMPFDRDVQNNADGTRLNCGTADRISKGIQAHSAPLGLTYWLGTAAPAAYRGGAVVGLHGSWNRSTRTGYKFVYFPWDAAAQRPGAQVDLVTGWLTGGVWGRPVDAAVAPDGGLYLSDDYSGTIYKLTYAAPPPPPPQLAVTSLTLINAVTDLPIAGFDPIPDGATIDLDRLPTRRLNIRANTSPQTVGSVRFGYDADASYRVESRYVYAIAGDNGRRSDGSYDYLSWTPRAGAHTVVATPYSAAAAGGTAGTAKTIRFTVVD